MRGSGSVILTVRLTPGASRDSVDGLGTASDGSTHVAARVRAVAEQGKANAALERLVADWLGIARSGVSVTGGAASRLKRVTVETGAADVEAALAALPRKG